VRFLLHTTAGFVVKGPIIFLPFTSDNLTTLREYYFNDLNVELSNLKRYKKQTFVEVELEREFRINCRFIRESTLT